VVKITSWVGTSALLLQQAEDAEEPPEQQLLEEAGAFASAGWLEQQLPRPRAAAV
jgi:hypothetical protein